MKELWVAAHEKLCNSLGREPTESEIRDELSFNNDAVYVEVEDALPVNKRGREEDRKSGYCG